MMVFHDSLGRGLGVQPQKPEDPETVDIMMQPILNSLKRGLTNFINFEVVYIYD